MELNILMIDDHIPIIEGYKSILSFNNEGYKINTIEAHNCEEAYNVITSKSLSVNIDMVFIDITLPAFTDENINSGEDLIPVVRSFLPKSSIVVLTSFTEKFFLYKIINEYKPNGLIVKNDITSQEFLFAFECVLKGERYLSKTALACLNEVTLSKKALDSYNRQIIIYLSQGVKNKTIQEQLHLSKSAIDKRKVAIKEFLGIDKGTDEDIIREAKKHKFI
jgi:DNA-binding NarL/FixJ family response regulator